MHLFLINKIMNFFLISEPWRPTMPFELVYRTADKHLWAIYAARELRDISCSVHYCEWHSMSKYTCVLVCLVAISEPLRPRSLCPRPYEGKGKLE